MARSFNGTTANIRADAARVYSNSAAWSVSFWVKVPSLASSGSTDFVVYGEANTGSANTACAIMSLAATSLTNLRIFLKNTAGTTVLSVVGTHACWDNTWHHVAVTQDASRNIRSFIDGVADISTSYSASTTTINDLAIGAFVKTTTANFFPGTLAEVANWTRQLSASEVVLLASGGSPLLLGATHFWPLFGADSPEPDIGTGTHTTGTLTATAFAAGGPTLSLLDLQGATVGV